MKHILILTLLILAGCGKPKDPEPINPVHDIKFVIINHGPKTLNCVYFSPNPGTLNPPKIVTNDSFVHGKRSDDKSYFVHFVSDDSTMASIYRNSELTFKGKAKDIVLR